MCATLCAGEALINKFNMLLCHMCALAGFGLCDPFRVGRTPDTQPIAHHAWYAWPGDKLRDSRRSAVASSAAMTAHASETGNVTPRRCFGPAGSDAGRGWGSYPATFMRDRSASAHARSSTWIRSTTLAGRRELRRLRDRTESAKDTAAIFIKYFRNSSHNDDYPLCERDPFRAVAHPSVTC